MAENLEYKKKLIKNIKKLQQNDYIYERLLTDRNVNLLRLVEESSLNEESFVKSTGDKIKEKLSVKLKSIDDDLEYLEEELDTVIGILTEMKDAQSLDR